MLKMLYGFRHHGLIGDGESSFFVFVGGQAGEGDKKTSAFADLAFRPDAAAHLFGALFGDMQPEAGAADLAGVGIVDAIEFLENMAKFVTGDANTGVCDDDFDGFLVGSNSGGDGSGRRIFDGVFDEVANDFA